MCVHAHTCFKLHMHEGASTQAHAQRVKGRISGIFLCHPPPYRLRQSLYAGLTVLLSAGTLGIWPLCGHTLFYLPIEDLNLGPEACMARTLTYTASSLLLPFLPSMFSLPPTYFPSMVTGDCPSTVMLRAQEKHPLSPLGLLSLIIRRKKQ